ncbi:class I SAM-dependent methyltransferase [Desulfovibrio sp.]|uniref:class I SAM-dependent methyltransferase n=1 Tax=Desulfovibrio sp. TaxID=885 RepID=UPI0023D6935E|nr:class I SAM-dependent methyltransferase [Desulfovibrio sp.]MDE7241633.1 methyltransferase domain-containing protein [Desulfovibrio sp.]
MDWNATLYEERHGFVAEYGKGLLEFVPVDPRQAILDLGCGTGTLTSELAARAGTVLGLDASPEMVTAARARFPDIDFITGDALELSFENRFDTVFSNAVFHWLPDHDRLLKNIRRALKPGGRLVCEFGAKGNVAAVENAFARACEERGLRYESRFTFPEPEAFARQLAENRFTCELVVAYARPTVLQNGESGLRHWLRQFFAAELRPLPESAQEALTSRVEELARPSLWNGKAWVADYRRLRAVAHS